MVDSRMFEDVSVEEFEEAMEGFEQWYREVAEEDGMDFDEWERCFLADLEKSA